MVSIRELERERWEGFELRFAYRTDGYYSFQVRDWDFRLVFHPYEAVRENSFTDRLFSRWVENPSAFGAFAGERLAGVVECSLESWNNRLRITNLLVYEAYRGQGVGALLMNRALEAGRQAGARMAVLETQTCNRRAIDFYRKMGFAPMGFDLYAYTNQDIEKTEVRLEMARALSGG